MSFNFNADEVFAIAEQIETNGAEFYRKSAASMKHEGTRKTLLELAAMEEEHERFFGELRKDFRTETGEPIYFDPDELGANYIKAFADGHVFEADLDVSWKFTGDEKPEDILRMAISFEKDAILFFLGLKDVVSGHEGKSQVDALIKEEQHHIVILSKTLASLV
jgi:rubrerythrin